MRGKGETSIWRNEWRRAQGNRRGQSKGIREEENSERNFGVLKGTERRRDKVEEKSEKPKRNSQARKKRRT